MQASERKRTATAAMKGDWISDPDSRMTSQKRRTKRTTLDRGMRKHNRSHKRERQYSDPTGNRAVRYTTGG